MLIIESIKLGGQQDGQDLVDYGKRQRFRA
jgi:hypothetical protein